MRRSLWQKKDSISREIEIFDPTVGCMKEEMRLHMFDAPELSASTAEERREYIKNRFPCIADCDMCGLCKVFRGNDPELAYDDYIQGKRTYKEISQEYKR